MRAILLAILGLCDHDWSWPQFRREPDDPAMGRDWQTCLKCGTDRISPVQFPGKAYR